MEAFCKLNVICYNSIKPIKIIKNHSTRPLEATPLQITPPNRADYLNFVGDCQNNIFSQTTFIRIRHKTPSLAALRRVLITLRGQLLPTAATFRPLLFFEHGLQIGSPSHTCNDLGRRIVYFPLESGLNGDKITFLTDIQSTKIELKKLQRRGREMLDYFLFLRQTLEYLVMLEHQQQKIIYGRSTDRIQIQVLFKNKIAKVICINQFNFKNGAYNSITKTQQIYSNALEMQYKLSQNYYQQISIWEIVCV